MRAHRKLAIRAVLPDLELERWALCRWTWLCQCPGRPLHVEAEDVIRSSCKLCGSTGERPGDIARTRYRIGRPPWPLRCECGTVLGDGRRDREAARWVVELEGRSLVTRSTGCRTCDRRWVRIGGPP